MKTDFQTSKTEKTLVTPKQAKEWLENHNTNNRKLQPAVVTRYAGDMAAGRWKPTHQGLAFNCDGTLLDGQHRLAAIVQSGIAQKFLVTTGLPKDVVGVIDDHKIRTTGDAVAFGYGQTDLGDKRATGMAEWLFTGPLSFTRRSKSEMAEFIVKHADAIRWVKKHYSTKAKGIGRSPVAGLFARAFEAGVPRTKLAHFCAVLMGTQEPTAGDKPIMALYRWLMSSQQAGHGWAFQSESYKRTQRALVDFLAATKISYSRMPPIMNEDAFPLEDGALSKRPETK